MRRDDSIRRGQSRSWYVSELVSTSRCPQLGNLSEVSLTLFKEWIHWREATDDEPNSTANHDPLASLRAAAALQTAKRDPKNKYVLVPDDPTISNTCPICQEKFETAYKEDTGEWVWEDAIKVGNRIYHASCHAEVKKEDDGRRTPLSRTATPDSVLGKRKAQVGSSPLISDEERCNG